VSLGRDGSKSTIPEHLGEDEEVRAIGVFDPDGSFMFLKQRK